MAKNPEDFDDAGDPPSLGYANADPGRMVPIARFPHEWMASVALTKLQSEGIVADLLDVAPLHGLVVRDATLGVQWDQVDRAIAILEQSPARDYLLPRE